MTEQPAPTPSETTTSGQPNTQGKPDSRQNRPAWMQELPALRFEPEEPDVAAPLIDPGALDTLLKDTNAAVVGRIKDDIGFLNYEMLRLFRERDHAAKKQQNRYRKYQISYLLLAAAATTVGSCQAITLTSEPSAMPWLAFLETLIALLAAFLATLAEREAPLPLWLTNRRRAEHMRREYFRYLLNLPPYDALTGYRRQTLLSKRAADINRGVYPPDDSDLG